MVVKKNVMVIVMVMFGKPKSTEDRKKGKEKLQFSQNLRVPSITKSSGRRLGMLLLLCTRMTFHHH